MDFSPETFNGLIQGANGVTGTLKGAVDLIGSIKGLLKSPEGRSDAEIEAAVDRLELAVENARLGNALLELQVTQVSEAVRRAQEAQQQLDRYEMCETKAGNIVYRLREADSQGQPTHFICPNCYDNGRRRVLQGDSWFKTCKECRSRYEFTNPNPDGGHYRTYPVA